MVLAPLFTAPSVSTVVPPPTVGFVMLNVGAPVSVVVPEKATPAVPPPVTLPPAVILS